MKAFAVLLAPPLLAACALSAPLNNLDAQSYAARGADPFWALAIGGESIALTQGAQEVRFRRALPVSTDGVRIWQSEEGTKVITVEARPGACTLTGDPRTYADRVTVSLSGVQLHGCGGRAERALSDWR